MIEVYIRHENLRGVIVTEMLHGAIIRYYKGGTRHEEFFTDEDYDILNEMFFDYREETGD